MLAGRPRNPSPVEQDGRAEQACRGTDPARGRIGSGKGEYRSSSLLDFAPPCIDVDCISVLRYRIVFRVY